MIEQNILDNFQKLSTKDVNHVEQMKDADGVMLIDEKLHENWKESFWGLLYENPQDDRGDGIPYLGHTRCVERAETVRTLKKFKPR